jgi:NAD+ diphosphatase
VITGRLDNLALARAIHDRIGPRRRDQRWLDSRLAATSTRVLLVCQGQIPVTPDHTRLVFVDPEQAGPGDAFLLGEVSGEVFFTQATGAFPQGLDSAGLREIGGLLDARDAGLAVHAIALTAWHGKHQFCPICGAATTPANSGEVRRCTADGSLHFPRTDPAVIMLVVDDQDRALLGHQDAWPDGRFSTLAGFVEPGEAPEQAVIREVAEEVGVAVDEVSYAGSQPWPFPSSLMIGFFAHAATTEIKVDGEEISDARWFSRVDLRSAVAEQEVVFLPGQISIARALIEHWYGGPLPGSW